MRSFPKSALAVAFSSFTALPALADSGFRTIDCDAAFLNERPSAIQFIVYDDPTSDTLWSRGRPPHIFVANGMDSVTVMVEGNVSTCHITRESPPMPELE